MTREIPKAIDRVTAIRWARVLTASDDVVFLDTETTGLGRLAEIVDLSIVAIDGTILLNQLVKPSRPIPIDAMLIHGITNDHVADAPAWCDVVEMARPMISNRIVVAFNSSFDRGMIQQCCAAAMVDTPQIEWQCAMRAYAAFRKNASERSGGYRWRPLHEAAEAFRLRVPTHRALADAMTCRGVVLGMARG